MRGVEKIAFLRVDARATWVRRRSTAIYRPLQASNTPTLTHIRPTNLDDKSHAARSTIVALAVLRRRTCRVLVIQCERIKHFRGRGRNCV